MRLEALFLLLSITSSDVLCLKLVEFVGCCEFSRLQNGHMKMKRDAWKYTKALLLAMVLKLHSLRFEHKFRPVAYHGHPNKLTELRLWKFKLEILPSQLPCRYPKTWHSNVDISDFGDNCFYSFIFWLKNKIKIKTFWLWSWQKQCIHKVGKIQSELKLSFGVYYWFLKFYSGILQLLSFAWDFVEKGQQLVWNQVG